MIAAALGRDAPRRRQVETLGGVGDARQRVAQLVAEHGQELVLAAVGRLGVALGAPGPLEQLGALALGSPPLGDVAEHEHRADEPAPRRRAAAPRSCDRDLRAVAPQQHGVAADLVDHAARGSPARPGLSSRVRVVCSSTTSIASSSGCPTSSSSVRPSSVSATALAKRIDPASSVATTASAMLVSVTRNCSRCSASSASTRSRSLARSRSSRSAWPIASASASTSAMGDAVDDASGAPRAIARADLDIAVMGKPQPALEPPRGAQADREQAQPHEPHAREPAPEPRFHHPARRADGHGPARQAGSVKARVVGHPVAADGLDDALALPAHPVEELGWRGGAHGRLRAQARWRRVALGGRSGSRASPPAAAGSARIAPSATGGISATRT